MPLIPKCLISNGSVRLGYTFTRGTIHSPDEQFPRVAPRHISFHSRVLCSQVNMCDPSVPVHHGDTRYIGSLEWQKAAIHLLPQSQWAVLLQYFSSAVTTVFFLIFHSKIKFWNHAKMSHFYSTCENLSFSLRDLWTLLRTFWAELTFCTTDFCSELWEYKKLTEKKQFPFHPAHKTWEGMLPTLSSSLSQCIVSLIWSNQKQRPQIDTSISSNFSSDFFSFWRKFKKPPQYDVGPVFCHHKSTYV